MTESETTPVPGPTPEKPGKVNWVKRFLPLGILVGAIVLVFATGLHNYLSFETLKEHRETLTAFVRDNAIVAALIFMAVYALVVALSLPGGAVMTITGGFLFGIWIGALWVVIAATIGATILFLVAKTSLGDSLRAKAGPWLKKMEEGFQEDALSYLLVLRLVPLFPFFVVNLVPAFLGVKTRDYVLATFFGIIPGSFVYASVGNGLGAVFDAGETPDLGIIFKPEILTPIIGLAVLALIPVIYKKWKAKKAAG